METKSKTRKLSELRAKTDRQLVALIEHKLESGLHTEVSSLLPYISGTERQRLEEKLRLARELPSLKSVYAA